MTTCTGSTFPNEFSSSWVWQFVGVCDIRASLYLVDYCMSVADIISRQHLRSTSHHQLVVPRHRLNTFGRRAFTVASPMSWNSLDITEHSPRESACDDNISDDCFKHSLKTFVDIDVSSAVEVFTTLRYINVHLLTYLLTYLHTCPSTT